MNPAKQQRGMDGVPVPSRALVTLRRIVQLALWAIATFMSDRLALSAPAPPVELAYAAPPECADKSVVLDRISALVRHRPANPIIASAAIERDATGYRLELRVEQGSQRIVSRSCDSLVRTLTVILALAIDPHAQDAQEQPRQPSPGSNGPAASSAAAPDGPAPGDALPSETAPGASAPSGAAPSRTTPGGAPLDDPAMAPPSPPAVAPVPAPATPPASGSAERWRPLPPLRRWQVPRPPSPTPKVFEASAQRAAEAAADREQPEAGTEVHPALWLLSEYGRLPRLAYGPSLGLWVDRGRWSWLAAAQWLLPAWAQMPNTEQPRGGHISFLGIELAMCRALLDSRLLRACAGIEAGDMLGKGSGVSNTQIGHGFWLAGTAELGVRPRIWSKLSADLLLGIAIPLKRPAFGLDGYAWRFEPEPWSVRLSSGFSWL